MWRLNLIKNMYAIKNIKKDEELFLHYGYKIWLMIILEQELLDDGDFMWRLLCWCLDGEIQLVQDCGKHKVLKISEAENFNEIECKCIIEKLMKIPTTITETFQQGVPKFTYYNYLWFLLGEIDIDCVVTFLDAV